MLMPSGHPRTGRRADGAWRFALLAALLAVALAGSLAVAASFGAVPIGPQSMRAVLQAPPALWGTHEIIFFEVRLPRVATAALVGAGLALAGVALQTVLRNPLAEPYLLGISSGASLGAVSVILLGASLALPVAALLGGLLALGSTLLLSGSQAGLSAERVILAGIAVTAFFSAITSLVIFQSPDSDSYRQVLHWLLGSLASATWQSATIAAVTLLVFGTALFSMSRLLGAFRLSDEEVQSLGIGVRRSRALVLATAALAAAGMVSISGAIGFVGLIVPHLARPLARGSIVRHLVASVLVGALLLVWADTFSRLIVAPRELPVGITTSILGAIAFAVIMLRQRTAAR